MIAFLVSLALVALLLGAAFVTMRSRRDLDRELQPTVQEHAAADAGRIGAMGATGSHGANAVGPPAFLEDVTHGLHVADAR